MSLKLAIAIHLAVMCCLAQSTFKNTIIPTDLQKIAQIRDTAHGVVMFIETDSPIGSMLTHYGEWAADETNLFEQILKPGDTVIDAGANIGLFTLDFAKFVGASGIVHAFEAHPFFFKMLNGNLALNAIQNVNVYNLALGDRDGMQITVPYLDFSTHQCYACLALGSYAEGDGVQVSMTTIDSLGLTSLRLIKVDVEGMELDVLQGAINTIKTLSPLLYVENNRDPKSPFVVRLLDTLGYSCHWHLSPCFRVPNNYYENPEALPMNCVSVNMLCHPKAETWQLQGFMPVEVPKAEIETDADWLERHRFF